MDAHVVAFRVYYPFKHYIPSKAAKYDIIIRTFCISETYYSLKVGGTPPETNHTVNEEKNYNRNIRKNQPKVHKVSFFSRCKLFIMKA